MGRKSTRYMASSVAEAVAVLMDPTNPARLTEWNRSGNERADLTRHLWEMDPACIVCGLDTFHSTYKGEATAVLFHLVPPSLVPGSDGKRVGYIGGGIGLACRACADAVGAFVKSGGEWVAGAGVDIDRVPCEWPTLDRTYRIGQESGRTLAYVADKSAGHASAARDARTRRGLPF